MQFIGPSHLYKGQAVKHFVFSGATVGSNSYAAPGTGLVYLPFYAWSTASAVGSQTFYNGTSGSALFTMKAQAGGVQQIFFHEEPSRMSANKTAVLVSDTNGVGVNEFHVFAVITRGAAGQDALGQ